MSEERELSRQEWRELCAGVQGADSDFAVEATIAPNRGSLEFTDTAVHSEITAYVKRGATDIRIGNLQFLVGTKRLVVIRSHPPYPIERWTVLYDGEPA